MYRLKSMRVPMSIVIACLFWLSLFSTPVSGEQEARPEIFVAAAVSLTDVLTEITEDYEGKKPGVKILLSFGATGALQRQVEQNAPVDLFAAANTRSLEELRDKGFIADETIRILCKNSLTMVIRGGLSTDEITSFASLTSPVIKKIAVGDPSFVPAGRYGMELLQQRNLVDKVRDKLVFAASVRQVLAWVEAGNVDAGIVYTTDAVLSGKVVAVDRTKADEIRILYSIGLTKLGRDNPYALDFMNYVTGREGKEVFKRFGFLTD